eukprot:gene6664-8243_t
MKPIGYKPVIAVIGKPNVGKSTLFNRVIQGQRQALVEEIPGTTRDRFYGDGFLYGRDFILVDTGGLIGETHHDHDLFQTQIKEQASIAMEEADAILFILDYKTGITPVDKEISKMLRSKKAQGKPIFVGVNKADNILSRTQLFEGLKTDIRRLGLGEAMPFSALHGDGVLDMFEEVVKTFPIISIEVEDPTKPSPIRVSIVGQPNAGKSSLMNKIIEEERSIVSDIPGTTHDPVDCTFSWRGTHEITLVDTAGIRRRSTHKIGLEKSSVLWAMKAIERSHLAFMVIDATVGITEQDLKIASFIIESKKSVVLIINKWDLYTKNKKSQKKLTEKIFFDDLQYSSNRTKSVYSDSNLDRNYTYNSLLNEILADNKESSKVENQDKSGKDITNKKKKSSILEEKAKLKRQQQIQSELDALENQYNDELENYEDDEEDEQENQQKPQYLYSSEQSYDNIQWEYLKKKEELESEGMKHRPPPPPITLPKLTKEQQEFEKEIRMKLSFLDFVPVLFTSAKTGYCVPTAVDLAINIFFEREKRLRVKHLMEILKQATFKHKLPTRGKNNLRIKFAQQAKGYPPSFIFFVNDPEKVPPTFVRYLLRSIRDTYPFTGTPIHLYFRKNKRKPKYSSKSKKKR